MNKLLILLSVFLAGVSVSAGQPVLEIVEFGRQQAKVKEKLTGREQNFAGTNWKCKVQKSAGPVTTWQLTFSGNRHEPVRLTVKFTSPLDFAPSRFWDGYREHRVENLPLARNNFLEAFPLAAAENGSRGQALGFAPQTILSGFQRRLTADGLSLETRIVVDDRRVQQLDVAEYRFTPEFGWRNAVEDYQNAFPAWFRPVPGVDKRIYGVSGYLLGGHLQRPFELHAQRHSRISWEWTYAPWYESGNWFPTGKGWKQEKNLYWDYFGHRKGKMLTREEYHDALTREMHYGNKVAALFYYILVKDIHQNVAVSYPEAVQGSSALHSLPTNRGKTKAVFAPGSKIFDYLKEQIRQVVENYEISGFSFDMANSSYHFTTPSQLEYAVGRSWYDDGTIFTSDTVAPIPFSDYIHTLSRDGKRMGTIFNFADRDISPFTFFHSDGAIIEGPPFANIGATLPLRLIMGRKPITFWHWQTQPIQAWRIANDPVKKAATDLGFKHFYLLKCYELGYNFMNWVTADPYFHPHLSVIRALSESGYHPVSAVKDAGPFWVGRFGDDLGTILTFSNPKREKITRTVRVVNRYLGKGKYGFIPRNGTLEQTFAKGETVFTLTFDPKELLVLRTVKIDGDISALTASEEPGKITLKADEKFKFTLPAGDFDDNRIAGAGKGKVFSGQADKTVKITTLPPVRCFGDAVRMADFMAANNDPAVEAGNGRDVQIAAEMVAMYRPHVAASMKLKGSVNNGGPGFMDHTFAHPDLTVTAPGKGKPGKKICLGTPADFPNLQPPANWQRAFLVMPDADTLWIGGSDPAEVRQAALAYFDLLDKYRKTRSASSNKNNKRKGKK